MISYCGTGRLRIISSRREACARMTPFLRLSSSFAWKDWGNGSRGKWMMVPEGRSRHPEAAQKIFIYFLPMISYCMRRPGTTKSYALGGIKLFCKASSQHDNFAKSLMHVSQNIYEQDARRMSHNLGIPLTNELGRYLGLYIIYKGVITSSTQGCCKD